mmetsp:Transcript_69229/g.175975  ORF Transcript_69229/g.175975 Transcript_69229/m.175975 type:complete len:237 (+) Transcript_69229:260-970(+)
MPKQVLSASSMASSSSCWPRLLIASSNRTTALARPVAATPPSAWPSSSSMRARAPSTSRPSSAASSAKNRARRKASSSRLAMAAASASRAILLLEVRVASSVASASSKAARPAALPSARARWMASSSASSSAQTFPKLSRATRCARVSPGLGVLGVGRGVEPVRCRFDLPLGDLEPVSTMNLSIPAAASSLCCGVRSLLQTQLAVSPMAPNTGCQAQQATPNHAMFSIDGCAPGFP